MPFVLTQPVSAQPITIDKIVAIVNNGVITQTELDRRVALLLSRLKGRHVALPPHRLVARRVLAQMVLERLELQYAKRIGIRVTRAQVRAAKAELAARNHMSTAQFNQALASQGFTPKGFRKRLRTEITIRDLIEARISRDITVSRAAVSRLIAQEDAAAGKRYRLAEIALTIPRTADNAARLAVINKARTILARIKDGERFSQAAIAYSQDQYALQGGRLGWRTTAHLRPIFLRAAATMSPGDVRLVQGQGAVYLVKVLGVKGGHEGPAHLQVRLREIVLRPSPTASIATIHEKLKAIKSRIAHGQKFASLARAYSQAQSAVGGGLLSWVSPRALPSGLSGPAQSLPLHTVGGPYVIPHGQALIEVVGRRLRRGLTRAQALSVLRMRKGNALYVRWLQTLRDDAYVRYPHNG